MEHVASDFPVFVLVGLLVGESYYARTLVPRTKQLKRHHLGTTDVPLHSRDIRRFQGPFTFLKTSPERKNAFHKAIGDLFLKSRIRIYAVAIDKKRLREQSLVPLNPYDVSLSQLLSVVCGPPRIVGPSRPSISRIIAESRGRKEELQREYQGFRQRGLHSYGSPDVQRRLPTTVQNLFPLRVDFARKSDLVAGLELSDLAATQSRGQ